MLALLLSVVGVAIACSGERATQAQEITFDQLFTNPGQYNGKNVAMEGFYFQGFEVNVLSEKLEYSGSADGHLVPKGRIVWVEGGVAKEVYDKLYQQQMMGPAERYGRARVSGRLEYGGEFGHLGGYRYQITPSQVEILPWSPPAPEGETLRGEGFTIYLLARDILISEMPVVSHLELADRSLLSLGDIVSYSRKTHEIELSAQAAERLLKLEVPTNGKVFVVCVDRQPVYWGAFWTPISSMSFDGVTILKPLSPGRHTIRLELGYPSGSSFSGENPRPDPKIMQSLQQADKLR
ncbi:MAG: hypothetical protein ABIH46_08700 [Chloroflexota bacterium]